MFREMRRIKQSLSQDECKRIIEDGKRCVISMMLEDGYPYCIPMNYYYDGKNIYFHCAKEGQKIDAVKNNNKMCITILDNPYYDETGFFYYVKSVLLFGFVEFVEDKKVLEENLRKLGNKYAPNEQYTKEELKNNIDRVLMLKFNIEHMTGKLVHEK